MKEESRTKKQLIKELEKLQKQLACLKKTKTKGDFKKDLFQLVQVALNNASEAIAWIRKDARILYVNDTVCNLLGYSREEMLTKTVHDIDPGYTPEVWKNYWKELRRNGSLTFETVAQKKDGTIIPMEVTANFVKHGNDEYNFSFSKDITRRKEVERELKKYRDNLEDLVNKRTLELSTANQKLNTEIKERKKTESELRESEARYQKLMETANDAIFIADANTGIIFNANKKAGKLLGIPPEKIIGMHHKQMYAKEDQEYYDMIFFDHIKREKGAIFEDIYVQHKNGYKISVEISSSVINVSGKKIIQGIFRDITDRKKAEETLKKSEEKYQNLIEHANDAIISVTKDGKILGFNKRAEEMFGYSRKEILGRSTNVLVAPKNRERQEKALKALGKPGSVSKAIKIYLKD